VRAQRGGWPCKALGCPNRVIDVGTGRTPEFCSDTCRVRAWRNRDHDRLAIRAAERLSTLDETALIRALAALPKSALRVLAVDADTATQAEQRFTLP